MKALDRWWLTLALAALLGAGAYALDRHLAWAAARDALTAKVEALGEARRLHSQRRAELAPDRDGAAGGTLKPLVQEAGKRNGIQIVYLTETEKDLGRGLQERNAVCRAVNVTQAKWVAFLSELEAQGGGAKVREIRLEPHKEQTGQYREAECVLGFRWARGEPKAE